MLETVIYAEQYDLPDDPSSLPHKRMNLFEWLASSIVQSHVCLVCKRKEIWSVRAWLQISDRGVVVCNTCVEMNAKVFKGTI